MIRILAVLAMVVALVLVVNDSNNDQPAQASDQKIETGWSEFDSLLADKLPDSTQTTVAGSLSDSANFFRGVGADVVMEVKNTAERR